MKVVRAVPEEFQPVSVTVTFETQEEIDLIYNTYAVTMADNDASRAYQHRTTHDTRKSLEVFCIIHRG